MYSRTPNSKAEKHETNQGWMGSTWLRRDHFIVRKYLAVSGQFFMDYFLEREAVSNPSVGEINNWKVNAFTTGNQAISVVDIPYADVPITFLFT